MLDLERDFAIPGWLRLLVADQNPLEISLKDALLAKWKKSNETKPNAFSWQNLYIL
jgi:hypothetical protein